MASLQASRAIAGDVGDPTWLAYTIYGNPSAPSSRVGTPGNHEVQGGATVQVTDDGVPVKDLIEAVKEAIKTANVSRSTIDQDLLVGSVRLTLHAVATR